jgi:hypothetical protein
MRCLVPVFDSDFPSLDPMDCKVESIRGTVTPAMTVAFEKEAKPKPRNTCAGKKRAKQPSKGKRSVLFYLIYFDRFLFSILAFAQMLQHTGIGSMRIRTMFQIELCSPELQSSELVLMSFSSCFYFALPGGGRQYRLQCRNRY